MGQLTGKLLLVTGAGTGIGKGIALEAGKEGAAVVLHYTHSAEGAEEAAEDIRALGGRSKTLCADLSSVAACRALVDEAVQFLGGLDVLVNNSGITLDKPFLETREEDYDLIFGVNMRGMYFCSQQAVPHMISRGGGSIVNISSIHAFRGLPCHSVYAATKGGIVSFTQELAVEMAPNHVRVNCIAPGFIEVPRYFATDPTYTPEKGASLVPWGRAGAPVDIARIAVFLASDAADLITGTAMIVDGGTTAKMALGK